MVKRDKKLSLFFYPDIYNKLHIMIKQTWEISKEERNRIITLHESATKNFYLLSEQNEVTEWELLGYIISKDNGKYYVLAGPDRKIEIPTVDQLSVQINKSQYDKNRFVYRPTELTQNALNVGEVMGRGSLRVGFSDGNGKEVLEGSNLRYCAFNTKKNVPEFGQISFKGSLYRGQFTSTLEKIRERVGSVVTFNKNYTDNFIIELNDLKLGNPVRETPPTPITPTEQITKVFDITSPFEFDKTELTPEAEKSFKEFIEIIKRYYNNIGGDVTVTTSASIDSDPTKTEQYNMDLSKRRSQTIIDRLEKESGNNTLNFIPNPIGQTDQFEPGLKWPEVKDKNLTAPNRRLIIKLPEITQ
jgi:outer membrane protein OmpA-like peptidoglycan-associated protein